jgi:hypothetical protein
VGSSEPGDAVLHLPFGCRRALDIRTLAWRFLAHRPGTEKFRQRSATLRRRRLRSQGTGRRRRACPGRPSGVRLAASSERAQQKDPKKKFHQNAQCLI